jgi:hypothetical protein
LNPKKPTAEGRLCYMIFDNIESRQTGGFFISGGNGDERRSDNSHQRVR